jgi:hypothetical protein
MRTAINKASLVFALPLLALLLRPSEAGAYDMMGATIELELQLPSGDTFTPNTNPQDIREHFNLAGCTCDSTSDNPAQFAVEYNIANYPMGGLLSEKVYIFVGNSCDTSDLQVRDMNCGEPFETFGDIKSLYDQAPQKSYLDVHTLTSLREPTCAPVSQSRSVYAIVDENLDGVGDGDYASAPLTIDYDLEPPPIPDDISATGGENAIQLKWKLPSENTTDIQYFQVLCAREDGSSSEADGFGGDPDYLLARDVCNRDDGTRPIPAYVDGDQEGPDAGVGRRPITDFPALYDMDSSAICGEATGSNSGVRVEGLENGVAYRLVLVVVDPARNATALDLGSFTPQPVKDAWELYLDEGGHADGGYCFVATASFGDYDHPFVRVLRDFRDDTLAKTALGRRFISWYYATSPPLAHFIARHTWARVIGHILLYPLVLAAAIWEYTGFFGKLALLLLFVAWRRRRKGLPIFARPSALKLASATGVLLLLGLAGSASAQPYWDDVNDEVERQEERSYWNFETRMGPYVPSVDDEFRDSGSSARPFETTFGKGPFLMTQLSLDRFFLFPEGQLGVTASIGFMGKKKNAFQVDGNGNVVLDEDGDPVRSPGDKTAFRLMPTSIGAVYRATILDDQFGIPLVPYGKAGIAYYLWWITDPSGGIAEAPTPDCMDAGEPGSKCTGSRARGGSFGLQASLGLAIRAERIDPDAAFALRNEMGIEHAGFFAEVSWAQVDGFGADNKLSVGDATWYGGINFEF